MTSGKRSVCWVSSIILDIDLHKTSQLEVLRSLAGRGHSTTLIASRSKVVANEAKSQTRVITIPLKYLPVLSPIIYSVVIFFLLPFYIAKKKPDFIIMDPNITVMGSIPAFCLSRLLKTKFVLSIRSTPVEIDSFRGLLRKFAFSLSVQVAKKLFDGITIITPLMREKACRDFGIDPRTMGVWTSGVSTMLFNPTHHANEAAELRKKLGLSNKFVVFYHGIFSANRGLIETAQAMKVLTQNNSRFALLLLGTGPIISKLRGIISQEKLENSVFICDPVTYEEVPKFISVGDVCILPLPGNPYWRFQSPLKLLEYLAMEKVVIATDIPAHRSVIGEAKCGIYISSIKPTEIAEAIEYSYLNKKNLEKWGKIGREIVEEKYTWEKVAKDLEHYLLSIDELRKK